MRSFVLVVVLFFQTAFACSYGPSLVFLGEIESWMDGTSENLILLKNQGLGFNLEDDKGFNLDALNTILSINNKFHLFNIKIFNAFFGFNA